MAKHKYGKSKTNIQKQMKQQRRDEATVRQIAYDALTVMGKLEKIATRHGASSKETKKLQALLAEDKKNYPMLSAAKKHFDKGGTQISVGKSK